MVGRIWLGEPGRGELTELMTPEQVAERLKVHPSTVYRLARAGEIEVVRIGRLVRIRPQALEQYIKFLISNGRAHT